MRLMKILPVSLVAAALSQVCASLVSAQAPAWNPSAEKYGGGSGNVKPADVPVPAKRSAEPAPAPTASATLPGKTLANAANTSGLRKALADGILSVEKQQGAKDAKIVDTAVTQAPKGDTGSDLTTASWTELWTVQRGGKKVGYVIAFTGQGKGKSISYKVSQKP